MHPEPGEALWLDHEHECSLAELAAQSGLSEEELLELVDYGAIAPLDPQGPRGPRQTFRSSCVVLVRTAYRLRRDFDLDPPALAFALSLLERMRELEAEVSQLRALLPRSAR